MLCPVLTLCWPSHVLNIYNWEAERNHAWCILSNRLAMIVIHGLDKMTHAQLQSGTQPCLSPSVYTVL